MKFYNALSHSITIAAIATFFYLNPIAANTSETSKDHLSSTIGALQKVINENTQVDGVNEQKMKLDPKALKTYEALQSDLDLCQTEKINEPEIVEINKDGVSMKFKTFHLKIYGQNCPLEIEAALNSKEQNQESLKAQFLLKLVFKNQKYIDKYKLRNVEATGVLSAKAVKIDTTVLVNTEIQISAKGNSIELQDFEQNIGLKADISLNMSNLQFGMLMIQNNLMKSNQKIDKAYSKIDMQGLGQFSKIYSINDKEVSETEYQKFLQSFVMPSIVSEEDPSSPDSRVMSECSFAVFEKEKSTLENFKKLFQAKNLPKDGLVTQGQSCMKDNSIAFNFKNKTYNLNLQFAQDWIVISSDIQSNNESATVYVLYGDQEAQVNETNEFWLGLQCKPVHTCQ